MIEDWPCAGCSTITPPAESFSEGPRPLLVALHGDGGGVRPLVRAWRRAAASAGVILLAPRCPRDRGCTAASWWQWYASSAHDPAWLGAQIDAVTARFAVDPKRVYATGYSGGATYLGWYAPAHPLLFAAVAHVAGGAPYRPPCPACKLPVLFVLGSTDPMIVPYTKPLRDYYEACGSHEIVWETLPGVTHESILGVLEAGRARSILSWLLARPSACLEAPAASIASIDAGALAPAPQTLADAGEPIAPPPAPPERAAPPPPVPHAPAGCACAFADAPLHGGAVVAMLIAAACLRRRASSTLSR